MKTKQVFECPKCKSEDIRIEATVVVKPRGETVVKASDFSFNTNSYTLCNECEYEGQLIEFEGRH